MAVWLAERVGESGQVVATDIDVTYLKRLNLPNLEVRQHNILDDPLDALDPGSFDLVCSRSCCSGSRVSRNRLSDAWWSVCDPEDGSSMRTVTGARLLPWIHLIRTTPATKALTRVASGGYHAGMTPGLVASSRCYSSAAV